jgi:class 3 adenylate cyclase
MSSACALLDGKCGIRRQFTDPGKALQCAAQIQQTLAETPISVGDGSINVRIGLHTGTPIVYRDDVSGRTDLTGTDVDKAARVESIARGGQVLISEQTRVLTDCMAVHDWGFWELQFFPSDIAPAR